MPFFDDNEMVYHHHDDNLQHYNYDMEDGDLWHRFLAKIPADQKPSRSDYSVLSVSVMTLALILIVEILRHRLDCLALGRPLFSAVLEGVYRECKCTRILATTITIGTNVQTSIVFFACNAFVQLSTHTRLQYRL
jgi:hypothetical protein